MPGEPGLRSLSPASQRKPYPSQIFATVPFFTPWSVCQLLAQIQGIDLSDKLKSQPFVTVCEPACGATGMTIAFAEQVRQAGYLPQQHLWVSCTDIDAVAASMAYLQLSLLKISGQVITGNLLTLECRQVLYTPAHYRENWACRLALYQDISN